MWEKTFQALKPGRKWICVTKCPSFKVQILNNPCINSKTEKAGQLLLRSAASINTVLEYKGHSSFAEEFFPDVCDRALQC